MPLACGKAQTFTGSASAARAAEGTPTAERSDPDGGTQVPAQ